MKALDNIVRLVIVASLSILLSGGAEGIYNTDNIVEHLSVTQAELSDLNSHDIDEKAAEDAPVADIRPSLYDSVVFAEQTVSADPYVNRQWALKKYGLWQITEGKPEIIVAVLDTGIDSNHEDLRGKVVSEVNFSDSVTVDDIYGHGTHVAGIIAANANNGIGIAGLAPASLLMNVKVTDDKGKCQASALARGIIWAADNGANVINISVELRQPSAELKYAVDYAWFHGALIVAAAGNDGNQSPVFPSSYENCLAVAALRQEGTLAPLSNFGDWVDVVAPGFDIYSTIPDDGFDYKTGTSFAAAHVSGLAARLFSVMNDSNGDGKTNDEVRATIEALCSKSYALSPLTIRDQHATRTR